MKKFCRNETDGYLFGVCQGIAEHFDLNPTLVRIFFLLVPHMGLVYIALGFLAPEKDDK